MKKLELAYDRAEFWQDYWRDHGVDRPGFRDLNMYPIRMTLRHVRRDQKILECGCGAGRVVRHLAGHGFETVGLDYEPGIVTKLKTSDPRLKILAADAARMPFPDNSFDVSLCFGAIGAMHTRTAAALCELRRVTRSGGTIVLSVMLYNMARRLQKLLNRLSAKQAPEFYAWMDSERDWRNYFESFGLETIETDPMVSRYNVYYWTTLLRSRKSSDLAAARVDDAAYQLNVLGRVIWQIHSKLVRQGLAGATTFAMRNAK